MADLKLSELPTADPLAGTERLYVVQGGVSKATDIFEVADFAMAGVSETIDDRVASLLVAGEGVTLTYDDAGNALTIKAAVAPVITTVTWASSITIDLTGKPNRSVWRCTLVGNTTIAITGGTDGQMAMIELTQDATGSRLVTLGSEAAFGTTVASYTATTTPSKCDVLGIIYNSAASKYRVLAVAKGY